MARSSIQASMCLFITSPMQRRGILIFHCLTSLAWEDCRAVPWSSLARPRSGLGRVPGKLDMSSNDRRGVATIFTARRHAKDADTPKSYVVNVDSPCSHRKRLLPNV
jgi:hypothetical protein